MSSSAAAPTGEQTTPLLLFGALVTVSFLAARFLELPEFAAPAWKAAGIVILGAFALTRGAFLAAGALFLSAVGDVALELRPPIWLLGMAAFGAAHLFYAAAFAVAARNGEWNKRAWPLAALVFAASVAMLVWFWPDMGALRAPGLGYQAIITLMVMLALLSPTPMIAKLGAAAFMISDTLIALGLYKEIAVIPGAVWVTYGAAQIMLAMGLASARRTSLPAS